MIDEGVGCSCEQWHRGNAGEIVASECGISRGRQDGYAATSHHKAAAAAASGAFDAETLPIEIPQKKGAAIRLTRDESIRPETTAETLATLKPAFRSDGTVTAGNAPPVNDGAAALVVMSAHRAADLKLKPMARILGQATSGLAPRNLLMTPVEA